MSQIQDAVETLRVPPDEALVPVPADAVYRVPDQDYLITIVADDNVILIEA